jgi:hypothetical protein
MRQPTLRTHRPSAQHTPRLQLTTSRENITRQPAIRFQNIGNLTLLDKDSVAGTAGKMLEWMRAAVVD